MIMALAVGWVGREDEDVDGMACAPRSGKKYLDTVFSISRESSSFRRFGACREDDALSALDEPALPPRPSTWRASLFVIRRLYGFEPNPCANQDRSFIRSTLGKRGARKDVLFLGPGSASAGAAICWKELGLY